MTLFIAIFLAVVFIIAISWVIIGALKQSKKDWDICNSIKERSLKVSSKEEIEALHKELVQYGNTVHNQYIHKELSFIDGYLRGVHKQYKTRWD